MVNPYLFAGEEFETAAGFTTCARGTMTRLSDVSSVGSIPGVLPDPSSLRPYLYCHADPINRIDPTGRFTIGEFSANSRFRTCSTKLALASRLDNSSAEPRANRDDSNTAAHQCVLCRRGGVRGSSYRECLANSEQIGCCVSPTESRGFSVHDRTKGHWWKHKKIELRAAAGLNSSVGLIVISLDRRDGSNVRVNVDFDRPEKSSVSAGEKILIHEWKKCGLGIGKLEVALAGRVTVGAILPAAAPKSVLENVLENFPLTVGLEATWLGIFRAQWPIVPPSVDNHAGL